MNLIRTVCTDVELLEEIEPVAARALDSHLAHADDWMPHQYIPWSRGRDFDGVLDGFPWEPGDSTLAAAARDGLVHNLLSEDNLPSYHRVISELFGLDGAWGTWVNRWTTEENRHGTAIRDYLLVTRAVDPDALERQRSDHMQNGYRIDYPGDLIASLCYVTLQEMGTRATYGKIAQLCDESACAALMRRIAQDENRHMLFYRTVLGAARDLAPDRMMTALLTVMRTMRMPGHEAPGYKTLARSMALSGIYDPRVHHDQVLLPMARHFDVIGQPCLGPDGERAREEIVTLLGRAERRAERYEEIRDRMRDKDRATPQATGAPGQPSRKGAMG